MTPCTVGRPLAAGLPGKLPLSLMATLASSPKSAAPLAWKEPLGTWRADGGRRHGPALDGGTEGRFDGVDIVGVVHQPHDVGARQHQQSGGGHGGIFTFRRSRHGACAAERRRAGRRPAKAPWYGRPSRSRPLPRLFHGRGVEHVDHAGIADGDIELLALAIEEDDVGHAAQSLPRPAPCPIAASRVTSTPASQAQNRRLRRADRGRGRAGRRRARHSVRAIAVGLTRHRRRRSRRAAAMLT